MLPALASLAVLGALSTMPPYLGPAIGLELGAIDDIVEVVDHVVPGLLVFLAAGASYVLLRAGRVSKDSLGLAIAVAVCMLAGVWETSSHVPLVLDGGRPESPWGAVILHSALGPVIAALSLWLVLRVLSVEPSEDQSVVR
jgi:zinc transporter ZupT